MYYGAECIRAFFPAEHRIITDRVPDMKTKKHVTSADLAEILVAVRHMSQAMINLSVKWEQYSAKTDDSALEGEGKFGKYPFTREFSEEVSMVQDWVDSLEQRHDSLRLAEYDKRRAT